MAKIDYTEDIKRIIYLTATEMINEYIQKVLKDAPNDNIKEYVADYYKDETKKQMELTKLNEDIQDIVNQMFLQLDNNIPKHIQEREDYKQFKKAWSNYGYWGVQEIEFSKDCRMISPTCDKGMEYINDFISVADKKNHTDFLRTFKELDRNEIIYCWVSLFFKVEV